MYRHHTLLTRHDRATGHVLDEIAADYVRTELEDAVAAAIARHENDPCVLFLSVETPHLADGYRLRMLCYDVTYADTTERARWLGAQRAANAHARWVLQREATRTGTPTATLSGASLSPASREPQVG